MDEIGRGISTRAGRTSPSSTSSMEGPEGQRWISMVSTWVVEEVGEEEEEEEEATVRVAVRW